jgi:hypothetical protein
MAKDIICALTTSNKISNNKQVAFWLHKRSGKRVDALNEATMQQVVAFWSLETTISPNAKDVTRRRTRRT